jgi:murein L,D-transpeptidase YcbB/YkuD
MRLIAALAAILAVSGATMAVAAPRWARPDLVALAAVEAAAPAEGLSDDYGARALLDLPEGDAADAKADAIAVLLARDFFEGSARTRNAPSWHIARGALDYSAWLDDVLARHSVRSSFRALLPTTAPYATLKQALARCRATKDDCATLSANLDRWRALPRDLGQHYLWVDVPAFRLDLIENGRTVASHRIIVGKPGTQTPSFQAQVTGVTVNPWWNVPCSIVDESVGKLIRTNPKEAARRGYVASKDASGKLVVRQKPGPDNALGRIKLEMPNPYGVYIHDTPSRNLFAGKVRALSHGCIRTEDPKSLALILLGPDKAAAVELLLATGVSKTLKLSTPVPVYIVYMTAEPDPEGGDGIATHDDIYRRDALFK